MKKKALFIILAVVLVIVVGLGALFAFLNREKDPVTSDEFKSLARENGYGLADATEQFAQYDFIDEVCLAIYPDNSHQIEFYVFTDTEFASQFYANNKAIFEQSKGNAAASSNVNLKNYSKFTLSTDGRFKVLSRIDNTVIFVNVDDSYKGQVKNVLKALGY